MFSTLPKLNFKCTFTNILSFANDLNLDHSKLLLFGKELRSDSFVLRVDMFRYVVQNIAIWSPLYFLSAPSEISS